MRLLTDVPFSPLASVGDGRFSSQGRHHSTNCHHWVYLKGERPWNMVFCTVSVCIIKTLLLCEHIPEFQLMLRCYLRDSSQFTISLDDELDEFSEEPRRIR